MTHPPKTIAIIGAGPAGLIAAHKMLTLTSMRPTIFEKAARVGGLWDRESSIHPEMRTNFCRFTLAFSDLAYESVEFGRPPPVYPQAWMVERYLQEYGRRLPGECFEFGTRVVRVEKRGEGGWTVGAVKDGVEREWGFDYVVVATGYLATPRELRCEMDGALRTNPLFPVPVLHSTRYRELEQIVPLTAHSDGKPSTVLVVGGSHSGADVAGLIAHQASDAWWAPSGNASFPGVNIVHVTQSVMFPVPSLVRNHKVDYLSFHPGTFTAGERSNHPAEPLKFRFGPADFQENPTLRHYIKNVVEGGVGDFTVEDNMATISVMSDRYWQYAQDGVITGIRGVLTKLEQGQNEHTVTATVQDPNGHPTSISNIAAIINATGFNSSSSLDFLAQYVKQRLEFDPASQRLPMVLNASFLSQNPREPDIAVVGVIPMNWAIIEMQCRALARKWTGRPSAEDAADVEALGAHMRALRAATRDDKRRAEVPLFQFGDFVGHIEQAARELGIAKINGMYGDFDGFVCSARYVGPKEERREALKTVYALQHLQREIREKNRLLAQVVFMGLLGRWRSGGGAGEVGREIEAHARRPTAREFDAEYVVVVKEMVGGVSEEDILIARYSETTDEITLWATTDADQQRRLETGPLICAIDFHRETDGQFKATARMGVDVSFTYHLEFRGSRLNEFSVVRQVKDTPAETFTFSRAAQKSELKDAVVATAKEEWSADGSLGVQANEYGNEGGEVPLVH